MTMQQTAGCPKHITFFANSLLETAVWTFAELAIADHLAAANEPQTADEIAKNQGWNSEYLYRVLRAVADADIVREIESDQTMEPEKRNRFQLTEDDHFLTSNHPTSVIQSVETNNEFEKRNISKERYQYLAGDMFDTQTIPQADAYVMKHIIHDWDDNQAINILKSIRTATNGKPTTIFIIDVVVLPGTEENKVNPTLVESKNVER
ncbi:unnamed protein product [Rotaria magnacalcarata]|uniref:Acetylserotonin O-methyltransferase n=2 Tax=Rotaria magnacalcarata TaxID=392030 RepID=A0A816Z3L7_9BILA|nr:unnamed protein product [Rotaria magnacalcarata]